MKQVVQSYRTGATQALDVPAPVRQPGQVLVQTRFSLISAGTERAVVSTSSQSLIGKARARPDLVKRVIDKARQEGIANTVRAVRHRLDIPGPLGYSAAGTVLEVDPRTEGPAPGDLVACAGAGFANHAEIIAVPRNLCARLPAGVTLEQAAFGTVGAIALQGVRIAAPQLGELVAVIGLGLVGQLVVQLLRAAGCRVLALDLDPARAVMAQEFGAEAAETEERALRKAADRAADGRGVDAVILTAATRSSGPVTLAGELCREKGCVVVVGDVGLDVPRDPYYRKELELRLSRSYGPGRYDPDYEQGGLDYPYGYVRWTEQRNLAAFLDLIAQGRVRVEPLVTHRFPIDQASDAYAVLVGKPVDVEAPVDGTAAARRGQSGEPPSPAMSSRPLGILLEYPEAPFDLAAAQRITLAPPAAPRPAPVGGTVRISVIGAGNFARAVLLPALQSISGVQLREVATSTGLSARDVAQRFGFQQASTDVDAVLADPEVDAVLIATRHHLHAALAARALAAGKAVFVEKPMGLSVEELQRVLAAQRASGRQLMVGFNRRFAPLTDDVRGCLTPRRGPITLVYRVFAGPMPRDSWILDPVQGGGRIVSEACHFVDLCQHFAGSPPVRVSAEGYASPGMGALPEPDNVTAVVCFEDRSVATIAYVSAGAPDATGKERLEGFADGAAFVLDDFRTARLARGGKAWSRGSSWRGQDKGHRAELQAFVEAVRTGAPSPIDPLEAARASLVTLRIREALAAGTAVAVDDTQLG